MMHSRNCRTRSISLVAILAVWVLTGCSNSSSPAGAGNEELSLDPECGTSITAPLESAALAIDGGGRLVIPMLAGNRILDTEMTIPPFIAGDTLVTGMNAIGGWGLSHPECQTLELEAFVVQLNATYDLLTKDGLVNGEPPESPPTDEQAAALIALTKAGDALAQRMNVSVDFTDFEAMLAGEIVEPPS